MTTPEKPRTTDEVYDAVVDLKVVVTKGLTERPTWRDLGKVALGLLVGVGGLVVSVVALVL
jgi:hypothetical protein